MWSNFTLTLSLRETGHYSWLLFQYDRAVPCDETAVRVVPKSTPGVVPGPLLRPRVCALGAQLSVQVLVILICNGFHPYILHSVITATCHEVNAFSPITLPLKANCFKQ